MKYKVVNINDLLDTKLGEKALKTLFSEFSCKVNEDVEKFLKLNAVEFTKKKQSTTHIVLSEDRKALLGYFTLAVKPITINKSKVESKTKQKRIERVAKYDEKAETYSLAAYLIAEIGKNQNYIQGDDLMELAIETIESAQSIVGGMVVFVEAEPKEKLLEFYRNQGFRKFDSRVADDEIPLQQLLKIL